MSSEILFPSLISSTCEFIRDCQHVRQCYVKLVTICKFKNVRPTFGSVVFSNSEQCSPGNSGQFESGECYVFFVSNVLFFHVLLKIVKIKMFKKAYTGTYCGI
jgi:hypothetical protein